MTTLGTLFWNVLGYSTMVMIFVVGFGITAFLVCFLLERMGRGKQHDG